MNEEKVEAKLFKKIDNTYVEITKEQLIISLQEANKSLEQENKQLKEDLRVSQSNEETYSLEMQEITKILGLEEDTLFDDVKEFVKQLNEEHNKKLKVFMAYEYYYFILRDLEEWLKEQAYKNDESTIISKSYKFALYNIVDKIQELKEKYK